MSEAIRQKLIHEGGGCLLVNKSLIRTIGLHAAIIYSDLINKYLYLEKRGMLQYNLQGEFFCTVEDMERATTLSRSQQLKGIRYLVEMGLIRYYLKGKPAKRYFSMNWDISVLEKVMATSSTEIKQSNTIQCSDLF